MKIKGLKVRKVLATNAQETLEVELKTEKNSVRASVPMGTSKGRYEACYLPVENAISKFKIIKRKFLSQDFHNQQEVDRTLKQIDQTVNFREIGANLALAISSAFLKAFAAEKGLPLFSYVWQEFKTSFKIPKPICNIVGRKGQGDIEEILLLPVHQNSFTESIFKISSAYRKVGGKLKEADSNFIFGKDLESAWITHLDFRKILEILKKIANEDLLQIGLDFAASQLWDGDKYVYSNGERLGTMEQFALVEDVAKNFPVNYIEDPFHENDFTSFSTLTARLRNKIICGDDLYATHHNRLISGAARNATNAIIIKPNQVGTISDAVETVEIAKSKKIFTVMSHRSDETDDNLLSHLAVGLGCDYVKFGLAGERTIKLNEIIRIEENLNWQK